MGARPGFALSLALNCMALLLLSTLTFLAFLGVEMRAASTHVASMRLRLNLQQAALLGMSHVQQLAGRDTVHSFNREDVAWVRRTGHEPASLSARFEELGCSWRAKDLSQFFDEAAAVRAASSADAWVAGPWGRGKVPLRRPYGGHSPDELRAAELGWVFKADGIERAPVRGLLTDSLHGGFRTDLSVESLLAGRLGSSVLSGWKSMVDGVDPLEGVDFRHQGVTAPLLAGVNLSIGVFNSRADGRHRIRFHATGLLWNHLPVPLVAGARGQLLVVELRSALVVTVRNLETGASVEVDLDDIPELDLGTIEQRRRERCLWFIVAADEEAVLPMRSTGLLAGETYAFISPSQRTQPQGLARIMSPVTWRMDRRPHGAGWRRPSPEVMTPSDRIVITFRFGGASSLVVRRYVGDPAKDAVLADYSGEVVQTFEGLSFDSFEIETTAEDYSRPDSSGYVMGERRACLSLSRPDLTPPSLSEWASEARRASVANPAIAWTVRHPLAFGPPEEDHLRTTGALLWDDSPGLRVREPALRFGRAIGPELPFPPLLSVGSLRHLGDAGWADAMDSHAFLPSVGAPAHPRLRKLRPEASSSVDEWFIDGVFNVNATDPEEWASLLWSAGADAGSSDEAVFPTRPSAVAIPLLGTVAERALADHELNGASPDALAEAMLNQPFRRLSRAQVNRLATALSEEVARTGPFPSLAAFGRSGCLDRALKTSGINTCLPADPAGLPLGLEASDIIELLAPQLTVRGDTFELEVEASFSGATAVMVLVIERYPSVQGLPEHLGRRFRIISLRHRNPFKFAGS